MLNQLTGLPHHRGARIEGDFQVADEIKKDGQEVLGTEVERRKFVKGVGQIAVTVPAVSILLGGTKVANAQANIGFYQAQQLHALDDFTYGNNDEDIDGGPSIDDVT